MTDLTTRLAAALESVITRNPLLSSDDWTRYNHLIDEYNASLNEASLTAGTPLKE